MKAYTQLIENKVMVSTLPKPDMKGDNARYWHRLLAEFESSILGEVENACAYDPQLCPGSIVINPDSPDYEVVGSNQPCEVEGLTIKKML